MNGTRPHSKPGIAKRMLARIRLLRMKRIRQKQSPAWFAEFVDGRLDLVEDGKTVRSIPLADVVAVGESTNSGGPWADDHFLVVQYREAGEEKEMELPFNDESGVGDACTGLLRALGAPPVLPLLNCTHPASVFLWPPDKAGTPVWPDFGPAHSVGSDRDFARWRREHAPRTVCAMNADELAAFHTRRDEENRKARGALSYEEWFAERERLAVFLARRGVRGFEHGGLDPSAKRSWRERLHLLSGRLRRGRAFRGDFGLSDDWFENRIFGLQLLSSRMFRSGLLFAIRRHLGSPDNGFAVSIATDFPIVTETVVTARECVTDFAGDAVRKAEALARTDPAARRQLRDLRRLLGGLSPWRRRLRNLACLALASVLFVLACNLAVLIAAAGRVTPVGHAAEAPVRRAAVVMGCAPKLRGGRDNAYFTARIAAAAELWRAGKVEALVVSGDNHVEWYDEPSEMKAALVAAGVPEDRIACDYAGFRTLDSVVRAKTIFGLDSFLVVSQDFHVRRAIFLGRCKGLDVRGYAARGVPFGRLSSRTIVREPLARVAAVLDVLLGRRPRFGGPRVPLPQTAPPL